jgi:hypothetical protein
VFARVIMFFTILTVLLQSAPLRLCAMQEQITGTNCHGRSGHHDRSNQDHSDAHVPCDRGPSCQCQLPRVDADKANSASMPELLPPLWATVSVADELDAYGLASVAAPARPPDIPLAVQLPLLN